MFLTNQLILTVVPINARHKCMAFKLVLKDVNDLYKEQSRSGSVRPYEEMRLIYNL